MNQPAPIPSGSQPVLNGATPTSLNSPVNITDFGNAYGEFSSALGLFVKDPANYGEGIAVGYSILTGGAAVDFGIACFARRCHDVRVSGKFPVDAGHGAEDIWRLLQENNMDVAAVIARVGN